MAPARRSTEEILADLIGFDTVSHRSNLALIDYVADYLAAWGVACERIASEAGDKANLYATIGPDTQGGVVLSGHTDVVPVTNQEWDSDPFVMTPKTVDGAPHLFGRGTADMKGFIGCVLAKVPDLVAADLKVPVHIALSYDEEVGCVGISGLIAEFGNAFPKPMLAFVGEPTSMQIVTAHKGIRDYVTEITGVAAHSSAPHLGVNAIAYAGEVIGFIMQMAADEREAADPDSGFHPPFTTFNVGQIRGGEAHNIIPEHCSFAWEFRTLPGRDPDAIKARYDAFIDTEIAPRLRAENPAARVETIQVAAVPPLVPQPDSPAERLARHLTGANATHTVSFVSEASQYQEAGVPTVLCGPGNIEQAHQPDEWIAVSQLRACEEFLQRLQDWAESGKDIP